MPYMRREENGRFIDVQKKGEDVFGNEIKVGDLVVHTQHGYGIVTKLCALSVRARELNGVDLDKEYEVDDVKQAARWKQPAWGYNVVAKCTNCERKIVEVLPSRDFVVEYKLVNGHKFYIKFDWNYDMDIFK